MADASLEIRPLSGALGAEIGGVDLSGTLDEATIGAIRQAFLEHCVIFFRNQEISPEQHRAFARCLGEPVEYPMLKGLDGFPEITPIVKLPGEHANFGGAWHSDTTYTQIPPMGVVLCAREVPEAGGDTLFANMYLAYESLSDGMKALIAPLKGVNSSTNPIAAATRQHRVKESAKRDPEDELVAIHPVVRTHPETGRKALYVNPAHTVRFDGMTEEESAPLLQFLFARQIRPEFTCRFQWRPGSVAVWDNRCAQHNAVNDYHGEKRVMHRISLAGETPV